MLTRFGSGSGSRYCASSFAPLRSGVSVSRCCCELELGFEAGFVAKSVLCVCRCCSEPELGYEVGFVAVSVP